jgi:hypothetical protein
MTGWKSLKKAVYIVGTLATVWRAVTVMVKGGADQMIACENDRSIITICSVVQVAVLIHLTMWVHIVLNGCQRVRDDSQHTSWTHNRPFGKAHGHDRIPRVSFSPISEFDCSSTLKKWCQFIFLEK